MSQMPSIPDSSSDEPVTPARPPHNIWLKALVIIGGFSLLGAMATDTVAVAGRHLGNPFLGSIEIAQALVLISGGSALVMATLFGTHACVHLVTERLPAQWAVWLMRIGAVASAVFFVAVLAGSFWIYRDMQAAFEESEILRLSIWPLRIVVMICLAATVSLFLKQAVKGGARC